MNKNTAVFPGLFAVMLSGCAATGIMIDEMQPVADDTIGALAIDNAPNSEQKLAQTVTARIDGDLIGVYLPVSCGSGTLAVEIQELTGDLPNGTVLSRTEIDAGDLALIPAVGAVYRYIALSGGALSFASGDRYAIVLENTTGSCGIIRGPVGDSYPDGDGYFDARPNPPGWLPLSNNRKDLPFMTRIKQP